MPRVSWSTAIAGITVLTGLFADHPAALFGELRRDWVPEGRMIATLWRACSAAICIEAALQFLPGE